MVTAARVADQAATDLDLARRCARGERPAQRQLFRDHRGRVHATLYRILGSNRDMEDLVQDAFLEVFRSIASFRGEARLGTWISRITARVAYAHIGRRKIQQVDLDAVPPIPAAGPSAHSEAAAREAVRRLYAALERLDAKYRVAFALHVIDGRSLREVATITEASVVAVKTRVWRARKEVMRRARKDPLLASYLTEQEVSR